MDIPLTINSLHKDLKEKKYSLVELIDSYLQRIKSFDKEINSFITISDDYAFKKAKELDSSLKELGKDAFQKYPLLGAVVAHKDLFLTKGIRTTAASNVLKSYIPAYSGTVVKKLEKAGAIVIGKTNCDAWAHGASGENSDFGYSRNPWNKEYVPGGSSSGSACSVASNFSMFATGTDTGGSVRQPANLTGVVGFKPTYGAVSRYGVIAMASSLDSVGHFTRVVEDSKKIFEITRGEDGKDSTVKNNNFPKPNGKLRIGIPKEYFIEGIEKEVSEEVKRSAKVFENEGIELKEISLPNTKYAISVYYIIQPAEVSSNLSRFDGIRYGNSRNSFGDEAKRRIMLGTYVLSAGYYDAYYLKATKVRIKIIEDFEKAFKEVDAIIAPVSPTPAFKIGEKASDPLKMYLADIFTVAANIAGIPGLAIPSSFNKKELPLGFQLLGPKFSEETLFFLGEKFEKATSYKPKVAKL
ncbi:Asp-tRNA(Asn)/Glu-tRNA(Gln) amidotransferase subunit GatA [Patescibacteria group bacterium]|nr:Asp-tRNA(Asn)/Glu-tRNA(Gln) amidotransferase subunit GatA [Patescibacteria group bacterium]MBU2036155.1 Asp-tRNA(Asn)/Glu-tRNA(Gln) amidotransferase subunit GatA [Patescibacteria group bacterium]